MRVLMLTPYLPYPLLTGGQTRSYNLIKRLSSLGHKVSLFCLVKNNDERKYVGELEKYCSEVQVFNRPEKPWTFINILRTGFSFPTFWESRSSNKEDPSSCFPSLRPSLSPSLSASSLIIA